MHDPLRLKNVNNGPKPRARPQHGAKSAPPGNAASSSKQIEHQHDTLPVSPSLSLTEGRRFIQPPVDSSRIVRKPVPEDPREFQIKQLKRRFSPIEKSENGGTNYAFSMAPSDPDFPFEVRTFRSGFPCLGLKPRSQEEQNGPHTDQTCFATQNPGLKKHC